MTETDLKKSEIITATKEINKTLILEPPIDIYTRKAEIVSELKAACKDCLRPGDDFSLATLNVLEALGIKFPEEPEEEDRTVRDAAEVILDFMPKILEITKEILETLNDRDRPQELSPISESAECCNT